MTARKPPAAAWKPGQSGNPAGRRPGSGKVAALRESIAKHVPEIVAKLVEQAKAGDAQAARLLIERVIPPVKAIELPVTLALPADAGITEQGRALLTAAAAGAVSPGQTAALIGALTGLAKLIESEELEQRIAALEAAHKEKR